MGGEGGKKWTIAFLAPIDAHGHINAMMGLADELLRRGHRTVFICNDSRAPAHFGHQLIVARDWAPDEEKTCATHQGRSLGDREDAPAATSTDSKEEQSEEFIFTGDEKVQSKWAQMVDRLDLDISKSCFSGAPTSGNNDATSAALASNYQLLKLTMEREIVELDSRFERILLQLKPDMLVVDQVAPIPAVHRLAQSAGLRWLSLLSCNPMPLYHAYARATGADWFPPPLLGLPVERERAETRDQQARFERALQTSGLPLTLGLLGQMAGLPALGKGGPECEQRWAKFALNESPWLNLYMFPRELDYREPSLEPAWHQLDCLIRAPRAKLSDRELELLEQVARWRIDRKLVVVYVSLGSTGSLNLSLMSRLLSQLFGCLDRHAEWRFVVALGPRADQLPEQIRTELEARHRAGQLVASNWWPQPELFRRRLVDACISHGGNNTLCELFHFGVPALVLLAVFHDQLDNARRLEQLGLGVALGATALLGTEAGPAGRRAGERADLLLEVALLRALELARSDCRAAMAIGSSRSPRDGGFCARLIEQKLADC